MATGKTNNLIWQVSVPVRFETPQEMMIFMRKYAGLTQGQLAKKLRTKQSSVARWEATKQLPTLITLEKVSIACGFSMSTPQFACKKCHQPIGDCVCKKKKK